VRPDCADALAARLLGDTRTKLGGLHIAHARRVAGRVAVTEDDSLIGAALLHDVLEKTPTTADDLRALTRDERLVEMVERLSQQAGEPYRAYLARCATDPEALLLKRIDLHDKLVSDDFTVPWTQAARLRNQARQRLALLERLAATQELHHPETGKGGVAAHHQRRAVVRR
jgi:(p)ppGpp synthase/HD superfamily hydrolase